ncbi:MAG TPA: universal stress protein, partial [Bacteroidia bacterium]
MKAITIQRILIPMDFSETALLALEQAAFMARLFKAELYMLHVIEMMEFAYTIYDPSLAIPLEDEEIEENVSMSLDEQAR